MEEANAVSRKLAPNSDAERRGVCLTQGKRVCTKTITNLDKPLKFSNGNAKTTLDERIEAESDVRHAVSIVAAYHLMISIVKNHIIINTDATQFSVVGHSSEKSNEYNIQRLDTSNQNQEAETQNKAKKGINWHRVIHHEALSSDIGR